MTLARASGSSFATALPLPLSSAAGAAAAAAAAPSAAGFASAAAAAASVAAPPSWEKRGNRWRQGLAARVGVLTVVQQQLRRVRCVFSSTRRTGPKTLLSSCAFENSAAPYM